MLRRAFGPSTANVAGKKTTLGVLELPNTFFSYILPIIAVYKASSDNKFVAIGVNELQPNFFIGHGWVPEIKDTYTIGITATLSITESVSAQQVSGTHDDLALTENVQGFINLNPTVFETLSLTESVFTTWTPSVTDSLSVTEVVAVQKIANPSVSDDIVLSEDDTNTYYFSDNLSLAESVYSETNQILSENLFLTEAVSRAHSIYIRALAEGLILTDSGSGNFVYTKTLSDNITLVEEATKDRGAVIDTLSLVESVTATKSKFQKDTINLTEIIHVNFIKKVSLSDTISLTENTLWVNPKVCDETYNPTITIRDHTTLFYPFSSPTLTVNLRNPEFGDIDSVDTNAVMRQTRGGEFKTVKETSWFSQETLSLSFKSLTRLQAVSLIDLFEESAGDEIGLIDWYGRTWKGFISENPSEILQGIGNLYDANYSAQFKFEGVIQ